MGMYDDFRSSYDLGPEFTNVSCQTKDLNCIMDFYWLDPAGQLWNANYTGTYQLEENPNFQSDRSDRLNWVFKHHVVPTGKHGKLEPASVTDYVTIYSYRHNRSYDDWPLCRIHFRNGQLQDYQIMTHAQQKELWI
jgi:hypothetical protein